MAKQVSVTKSVNSLQVMDDAYHSQTVKVDPITAMAMIGGETPRKDYGAETALLAAAIIDNPRPKTAYAGSYSSARGYGYSNGFYGTFEAGEEKVPSYAEITGVANEPVGEAPMIPAASAEEKKGLKEYWQQYKWYLIALLIIVAAIVAYKKL